MSCTSQVSAGTGAGAAGVGPGRAAGLRATRRWGVVRKQRSQTLPCRPAGSDPRQRRQPDRAGCSNTGRGPPPLGTPPPAAPGVALLLRHLRHLLLLLGVPCVVGHAYYGVCVCCCCCCDERQRGCWSGRERCNAVCARRTRVPFLRICCSASGLAESVLTVCRPECAARLLITCR